MTSAEATGGENGLYNESFTYNITTGNLASKAGVSYTYDTNHPHAVSELSNGNTYSYDANGNMISRKINNVDYTLSYDAENRMVGVSKTGLSATFVYDADGNRVQSTINNVTTKFIGNHYEVEGTTVRKYYFAGSTRIAMRTGTDAPLYFLQDHLGSTSLTTDASGNFVAEIMYKAWGEVRSVEGTTPTNYTYTGQYSNTSDFGLMYYGARWYDSSLGRFSQPDSIIPLATQGTQAWDRYAYTNNNPIRYTDPTGHFLFPFIGAIIAIVIPILLTSDSTYKPIFVKDETLSLEPFSLKQHYENFDVGPDLSSALEGHPLLAGLYTAIDMIDKTGKLMYDFNDYMDSLGTPSISPTPPVTPTPHIQVTPTSNLKTPTLSKPVTATPTPTSSPTPTPWPTIVRPY